jgi:CHC2 zinc finger
VTQHRARSADARARGHDGDAVAFTFGELRLRTPELTEADRLAVFHELPQALQRQAEADCFEQLSYRVDRNEDLGPGTIGEPAVQEIANQIAMRWLRELVARSHEAPPTRQPQRHLAAVASGEDVLLAIPPADYVEALTGEEIPAHRMIRCPFHAGGQERTPSLKVYRDPREGWYCFSCAKGGTIHDFAGHLWGLPTRGAGFIELRRRLALELLRGAA